MRVRRGLGGLPGSREGTEGARRAGGGVCEGMGGSREGTAPTGSRGG